MSAQCPVCGYAELPRPAQDDLVCACCGTHFGYHDYARSYEELRTDWIARGARWFSRSIRAPSGWDPVKQLADARMLVHVESDVASTETNRTDMTSGTNWWDLAA